MKTVSHLLHIVFTTHYQAKVNTSDEEVWVHKICGYEYYGSLVDDFVCSLCKYGRIDLERIK